MRSISGTLTYLWIASWLFALSAATRAKVAAALRARNAGRNRKPGGPLHVHLWAFTPSKGGGFAEFNVPPGDGPGQWQWPSRI